MHCKYLHHENDDESYCNLVRQVVKSDVHSLVNDKTCQACAGFFPPTPDDWNPIIASLVKSACDDGVGTAELRQQAIANLWHMPPEDYVDLRGILHRESAQLQKCADHASEPAASCADTGCIHVIREPDQLIGSGAHRSGWPYAMDALRPMMCTNGILFDDFVEHRLSYYLGTPGYREPWVGVFHHPPPSDPHFLSRRFELQYLLDSKIWRDTEAYLQGGIALSEHLAAYLRDRLKVPIVVVKHPGCLDVPQWDPDRFLSNPTKQLIQLGWFGRNSEAIYQIPLVEDFTYVRVLPNGEHFEQYEHRLSKYNRKRGLQTRSNHNVVDRSCLSDFELRSAHTQNVFFTEMLSASANNSVIDCIASSSPLLVNRHPAVVEYLGPNYPLYFDDLSESHLMLTDENILAAHRYLQQMDKSWMTQTSFRTAMQDALHAIHGV